MPARRCSSAAANWWRMPPTVRRGRKLVEGWRCLDRSPARGDFEISLIRDSVYWWDGGAMFGVVPENAVEPEDARG